MKRLFQIAFDYALISFIPILSWFVLSFIGDRNIINVFSLTYPLQFVITILKCVFSTGANITKEKHKDDNVVMTNIVLGGIVGLVIFGLLALFADNFIDFMHMDVSLYHWWVIYYIGYLFFQLLFSFYEEKLYFEGKNKEANILTILFNVITFCVLIVSFLITKNVIIATVATLTALLLFDIFVIVRHSNKFRFSLHLLWQIKYDSTSLSQNILFLLIFLFGLSNAMEFGEKYALAISFVALITDTQWDASTAIGTVAKIDLAKGQFHYKEHRRNAVLFMWIMLATSSIMLVSLYWFYDLIWWITLIFFGLEMGNFLIYPYYYLHRAFLQLDYSPSVTTIACMFCYLVRFGISLTPTPYCTGLAQEIASFLQLIIYGYILHKHFKKDDRGDLVKKEKEKMLSKE